MTGQVDPLCAMCAGGQYCRRASKAACDRLVQIAAIIELARRSFDTLRIALPSGTVATALCGLFVATIVAVHSPSAPARQRLVVVTQLTLEPASRFFGWRGQSVVG